MKKIIAYIQETYNEMVYKVSWPTWNELMDSAIVVSIASLILAVVVLTIDVTFKYGLELIYSLF
jgi:preprotein translocase subunit SecE